MQIVDHLSLVCLYKPRHTLQFDDYLAVADEVRIVFLVKPMPSIEYRDLSLTNIRYAICLELNLKSFLVYGFKKTVAKFTMHSHACVYYLAGLFLIQKHGHLFCQQSKL